MPHQRLLCLEIRYDGVSLRPRDRLLKKNMKAIRHPKLFIVNFMNSKVTRIIPARFFNALEYRLYMGKKLNIKEPKTFNEKLQWLKLYDKNPIYTKLADKYEVRQYIKNIIGNDYIVPMIGIYESVDSIPFNKLPSEMY